MELIALWSLNNEEYTIIRLELFINHGAQINTNVL